MSTVRAFKRPGEEFDVPTTKLGAVYIENADVLTRYEKWERPTVIVSDGPYGLKLFQGDPETPEKLPDWYAPHVAEWSKHALPETTLWFWNTEIGWALTHPVLALHGWKYRALHVWDKGVGHVAGNVNSKTIRGFPVVTEVCARYVRDIKFPNKSGELVQMKEWLRDEWVRSGIPLYKTNEACGVKNAATRKYFTQCHLWYFPPPEMMERLVAYANEHGDPKGRPYFSLNGLRPLTGEEWAKLRAKWNHTHGITNVWREPAVRGAERVKEAGLKSAHANQKSLKLIERIIAASSDPGDVVWEPFGGTCSGAIASYRTHRRCYSAEISATFFEIASARLEQEGSPFAVQESLR